LNAFFEQPCHGDDKAGCAEAALGAVVFDHGLLYGTRIFFAAKAFDGDDVSAVELKQELDAGIDGAVKQSSFADSRH
jgi:hypothetical protein